MPCRKLKTGMYTHKIGHGATLVAIGLMTCKVRDEKWDLLRFLFFFMVFVVDGFLMIFLNKFLMDFEVLLMLYWCCLICFLMYFDGFRGGNVSRVYRVCIWTCQSCYRVHSNMMLDCLKLVEFVFDSFLKHSETNFKIKGTLTRFGVHRLFFWVLILPETSHFLLSRLDPKFFLSRLDQLFSAFRWELLVQWVAVFQPRPCALLPRSLWWAGPNARGGSLRPEKAE